MTKFVAFLLVIFPMGSSAQSIDAIDGKLFQVNQQGQLLKAGSIYYAVDPQGKKRALVKVDSVMEDTAIGTITQGTAQVGWHLVPQAPKKEPDPDQEPAQNIPPPQTEVTAENIPQPRPVSAGSPASPKRSRRKADPDEIERSSWTIEGLVGLGTATFTVNATSGSSTTSASASASTFDFGLDLAFHVWIKDFDIFLPQFSYSSLQISQSGASASGSKYDAGLGAGYLIRDYRLKISALYQVISGLGFSGASSAGIGVGGGFKVIAEYYLGSNYGVTLAYESISYAGGSVSGGSSGLSFGSGLSLSSFTAGFSYGF